MFRKTSCTPMPTLTSYWPTGGGGTFGSLPARNLNPTREEILCEKPNDIVIRRTGSDGFGNLVLVTENLDPVEAFPIILKGWAQSSWKYQKEKSIECQAVVLQQLVRRLSQKAHKAYPALEFGPMERDGYKKERSLGGRIILNSSRKTLSILTVLHELGHHFYGDSELQACRFSVWLFRAAFPNAYAKLEWEGHTLKRPPTC